MAEVKGKLLFLGMREVDRSENENGSEKNFPKDKKDNRNDFENCG